MLTTSQTSRVAFGVKAKLLREIYQEDPTIHPQDARKLLMERHGILVSPHHCSDTKNQMLKKGLSATKKEATCSPAALVQLVGCVKQLGYETTQQLLAHLKP